MEGYSYETAIYKTALVTGASSGIGLELSRLLAADGYDLILIARYIEDLNRVADEIRAHDGVRVRVIPKDLFGSAAALEPSREIGWLIVPTPSPPLCLKDHRIAN
jgi:short-subunit dehydrogenase